MATSTHNVSKIRLVGSSHASANDEVELQYSPTTDEIKVLLLPNGYWSHSRLVDTGKLSELDTAQGKSGIVRMIEGLLGPQQNPKLIESVLDVFRSQRLAG